MDANFEKIKIEAEKQYKNIGEVFCPYFKESISFNAKGLEHLKFKSKRKARDRKDAFMRLKNIHIAPEVLKCSHTLQEKHSKNILIEVKTKNKKEEKMKRCNYFGFVAIMQDKNFEKRVKVIVRQIEGGEKHFWSIIPFWKNNKQIKLHAGNPEND